MPWYRVRMRVDGPLTTPERLDQLRRDADRIARRHDQLWVTVTTNAGDVSGAVARALNTVDGIRGQVTHADASACEPPPRPARRRATAARTRNTPDRSRGRHA